MMEEQRKGEKKIETDRQTDRQMTATKTQKQIRFNRLIN